MENPMKMDDLGISLIFGNTHIYIRLYNQGQLVNCVTAQLTIYLQVLHEQESKKIFSQMVVCL